MHLKSKYIEMYFNDMDVDDKDVDDSDDINVDDGDEINVDEVALKWMLRFNNYSRIDLLKILQDL